MSTNTSTRKTARSLGRSFWGSLRAVAWSFIGIRGKREFQQDAAHVHPFALIGTGIVCTLLLVAFLMVLVHWIVRP